MRDTLIRVLKSGVPTALVLAALGWVMAEAAGLWLAGQPVSRSQPGIPSDSSAATGSEDVADMFRSRLPFAMAAWGFGIVTAFELTLGLWRGGKKPAARPVAVPTEDEVEKLLNDLLRQAEAAEAARAANPTPTPVPARRPAENSPVSY